MSKYLERLKEEVAHVNQIRFENLHRFFYHSYHVVQFCTLNRKQFKEGSGHFDIILDVKEKTNQTIKPIFDYLEKYPVR